MLKFKLLIAVVFGCDTSIFSVTSAFLLSRRSLKESTSGGTSRAGERRARRGRERAERLGNWKIILKVYTGYWILRGDRGRETRKTSILTE